MLRFENDAKEGNHITSPQKNDVSFHTIRFVGFIKIVRNWKDGYCVWGFHFYFMPAGFMMFTMVFVYKNDTLMGLGACTICKVGCLTEGR